MKYILGLTINGYITDNWNGCASNYCWRLHCSLNHSAEVSKYSSQEEKTTLQTSTYQSQGSAVSKRTEMLELDVHLTRDGEVVVSHDGHLLAKCGIDADIASLDFKDLPCYKPEMKVDFKPGFTLHCGEDRRIPTLREVFSTFPNSPINIDLKVYNEELIRKVHQLMKEYGREDLTIWGARSNQTTIALYKLDPSIPVFFSFTRVLALVICFYTGLLPFIPIKESALEIIMPSIALRKGSFPVELSWKIRTLLRVFDMLMMRPALFKHLERRGIQTYLWVLNEEEDFSRAFKLGATGVMTDFPTKLTNFLEQHPQYWPQIDGRNAGNQDSQPLNSTEDG
ncbi:lysophospholipase D GDPD1-like isoform X2 [Dreissena polymorpha]|uniref:lysophospholipase D GDPD1-like isoform X2 n=1 Tax=Dreissena polymorpha TaxID=45954 RepID=UPI002263B4FA|nr:lysophospholipase D GDPD1-like isoform X2 [Dreissena polymorpha]